MKFATGAKVSWNWAGRTIEGTVEDAFTSKVSRKIKNATITRNATESNPAYLLKSANGNFALKFESELTAVTRAKGPTPSMFG